MLSTEMGPYLFPQTFNCPEANTTSIYPPIFIQSISRRDKYKPKYIKNTHLSWAGLKIVHHHEHPADWQEYEQLQISSHFYRQHKMQNHFFFLFFFSSFTRGQHPSPKYAIMQNYTLTSGCTFTRAAHCCGAV